MDIKQLQYFVVSVDMGSFHAAAETLITTQPNVSKIVKSLEDELGMKLLERTRYGVKITEDGEQIYHYAIEILKNMKVIHNIKRKKNIERLKVCSTPSNELSVIISKFYVKYADKNIQVELGEAKVEEILIKIHRRQADMGFVYISTKNLTAFQHQVESKGMEYHEISKLPLYLFAGEKLEFSEEKIGERELRNIKLIQHNEGQYSLYNHLGHLKEDVSYGINKTPVINTNSDFSLIQFLKNTEYCSIGSCFWKESYEEYGIRAIPIEECEQRISFGYLKRTRDTFSEIAKEFLEYTLSVFNSQNKF